MALPKLDLSLYTHGDEHQRQELASQLLKSLQDHGFVKLVGHGIDNDRVAELFKWVRSSHICTPSLKLVGRSGTDTDIREHRTNLNEATQA